MLSLFEESVTTIGSSPSTSAIDTRVGSAHQLYELKK
nr:MAG TPA: hypothetical protein [Caudoviricetes sp.]